MYSLTHYNVTFNKALRWTCVVIDKSLPVPCFLSHFHPLLLTSHFKCIQQDSNCPNAQREAGTSLINRWSRCAHTGLLCTDEVETAHTDIHNQSNLVSVIFSRVLYAFAHFNHLSLAFSRPFLPLFLYISLSRKTIGMENGSLWQLLIILYANCHVKLHICVWHTLVHWYWHELYKCHTYTQTLPWLPSGTVLVSQITCLHQCAACWEGFPHTQE